MELLIFNKSIGSSAVRVKYDLQVLGPVCLEEVLDDFLKGA